MKLRIEQHQARYGGMLIMRGTIAWILAVLSMLMPEPFFLNAIIGVASLLIVYGVYEMANAIRIRRLSAHQWWLPLLDGSAAVCFGIVSIAVTMASIEIAIWVIAAWFLYYAICLGIAGALAARRLGVRNTLLLTSLFHALVAFAVSLMPLHPRVNVLALPSLGAAYVMMFGLWQMGAGWWLVQNVRRNTNSNVFMTGLPSAGRDEATPKTLPRIVRDSQPASRNSQ